MTGLTNNHRSERIWRRKIDRQLEGGKEEQALSKHSNPNRRRRRAKKRIHFRYQEAPIAEDKPVLKEKREIGVKGSRGREGGGPREHFTAPHQNPRSKKNSFGFPPIKKQSGGLLGEKRTASAERKREVQHLSALDGDHPGTPIACAKRPY